jgi:hypothetical protein
MSELFQRTRITTGISKPETQLSNLRGIQEVDATETSRAVSIQPHEDKSLTHQLLKTLWEWKDVKNHEAHGNVVAAQDIETVSGFTHSRKERSFGGCGRESNPRAS